MTCSSVVLAAPRRATWAAAAARIRVNAVSPGPTTTEGTIEALGPGAIAEAAATVSLSRPARAGEIARVVAFVASPRASSMTGATLDGDGGRAAV